MQVAQSCLRVYQNHHMAVIFEHFPGLQLIQTMPVRPVPAVEATTEGSGDQVKDTRGRKSDAIQDEDDGRTRETPAGSVQRTKSLDRSRHRSGDIVRNRRGDRVQSGHDESDTTDDDDKPNIAAKYALWIQQAVYGVFIGRGAAWRRFAVVSALCLYAVYFGYAEQHDFRGNVGLLTLTVCALLLFAYKWVLHDTRCSGVTSGQNNLILLNDWFVYFHLRNVLTFYLDDVHSFSCQKHWSIVK